MKSIVEFADTLSIEDKWYGTPENTTQLVLLKAGELSMSNENGNLRYISLGNREIVRMIYSAVRGIGWLTPKPVISDEMIDIDNTPRK